MLNVRIIYNGKQNIDEYTKVNYGTTISELKEIYEDKFELPILMAKLNGETLEMGNSIISDCDIEFLDITDKNAYLVYRKSVLLLIFNSIRKILGDESKFSINYSINQNWFCTIEGVEITTDLINKIENDMREVIARNEKIEKINIPTKEAIELLKRCKMFDRAKSLRFVRKSSVSLYKIEDTYDYLYGFMAAETKDLGKFKFIKNNKDSFTVCFLNRENINEFLEYKYIKNLVDVFDESSKWAKIIGIDYVETLNSSICNGDIKEIILISEALQEKKIAQIADMITSQNKKVALIAGPSSSGKTTFANRLRIQLRVNGINPYVISLDDYYLDKDNVPLDEEEKPDFEALEAIDVSQINKDLENLLKGNIVEIPKFNFITGKREKGREIRLEENEVIIIEGIHGLNEKLTFNIKKQDKFKIFISALTQLNIDSHNRIPTTDARIIRRMVRDYYFRGFGVSNTIKMWPKVRKGEVKHIFPFQECADVIFNSALIYELSVLKSFAEPLLYKVENFEEEYLEATRLIKFLDSFLPISSLNVIPSNSIIREFIGGGCF